MTIDHTETVRELSRTYLSERKMEVREATLTNQKYHIHAFADWAEDIELGPAHNLNGYTVNQFKTWKRDQTEIADITLYNTLMSIRGFLKWGEKRELIQEGVHEKLDIPEVDDPTRHTTIPPERATKILDYYSKYKYASQDHILFYLLYHTGIRVGTAIGIDVDDWKPEQRLLQLRDRPNTDTPLKNKEKGQRDVVIARDGLVNALNDYIENHNGTKDKHGRTPLFTTREGRPTRQTLQLYVQNLTQPCQYTNECPHGRDVSTCDYKHKMKDSPKCPSAVSPHPIRRSAITHHLNSDVPKQTVAERMNVSIKVLEEHYNEQTHEESANVRRKYLDNV